jgi:hypothetical protein
VTPRIDEILLFIERRVSKFVSGVLIGMALLWLARIYVEPGPGPTGNGGEYTLMSFNPFNFLEGYKVQNRILTSLLAHYAYRLPYFPYHDFLLFIDIIGVAFLALLYVVARRQGLPPTTSVLGAAVMAFSSPILFFIHFPGFTDITSYALILLAMCAVRNNLVWPWMLALALLNHESNFCVFPWFLLFYYLRNDRKVSRALVAIVLMGLSALPWYWWVRYVASYQPPTYGVSYYFSPSNAGALLGVSKGLYAGAFQAFKLFWVIPAFAVGIHLRERNFLEVVLYLLILACAGAQLYVAVDTTRLMGAAFPVIWLGFLALAQRWEAKSFQRVVGHLFLLNLFVPQMYFGHEHQMRYFSAPMSWFLKRYFDLTTWKN